MTYSTYSLCVSLCLIGSCLQFLVPKVTLATLVLQLGIYKCTQKRDQRFVGPRGLIDPEA